MAPPRGLEWPKGPVSDPRGSWEMNPSAVLLDMINASSLHCGDEAYFFISDNCLTFVYTKGI